MRFERRLSLLLQAGSHPENEVDKVTTPRGCTISGLNQMEHHGFSSALIRGIVTSAEKAAVRSRSACRPTSSQWHPIRSAQDGRVSL